MKINIRELTEREKLYAYSQSQQLDIQTGCIGSLQGNLGASTIGFFDDWQKRLRITNTSVFREHFDNAIHALLNDQRFTPVLEDRLSLPERSWINADIVFDKSMYFGLRMDVGNYAFLLRISADKDRHNLHCYSYYRRSLDRHIQKASQGIRFIDPNYQELFLLDDGDTIRILLPNQYYVDKTCRYVDDYHTEIGCQLYHILEFADWTESLSRYVIPFREALPEECYTLDAATGELLRIRKGETYYYHTGQLSGWSAVEYKNKMINVSPLQARIMMAGVIHGWRSREADPRNYNPEGIFILNKEKKVRQRRR